tara:strand:- start:18584 stop:19462 length:879 start_codon:yes stop_codon:yes gene_type:complete
MVAEEAASLKSEITQAKKSGRINGVNVSKEEIADAEEEVALLDMEVQTGRADFAEEVRYASQEMQMMQMQMEQVEQYYGEPKYYDLGNQLEQFAIGTTTYADLNQVSSGSDKYYGQQTDLKIVTAGSNAYYAAVGEVAGNFTATTIIDYSSRTVTQGADITVSKLGQNTTSRTFNVSTGHDYTLGYGDVKPTASYNVSGDDTWNAVASGGATSLTGSVSTAATDDTTYVEQSTAANTHYLVTVSSDIQNTSTQVAAGTVQTTVTVESEQDISGINISNKASGTDSAVSKYSK